jgi:hypothetical protein
LYLLNVTQAKKTGLWTLLGLLALFLNTPILSGLVLCVDQNGHLELELSIDGKCESAAGTGHDAALHSYEEEAHGCTCIDFSLLLSAGDSLRSAHGPYWGQLQAPVAQESFLALFQLKPKSRLYERPPPQEGPLLAHIRTVRLLI